MTLHPLNFSRNNRRILFLLVSSHLLWCCAVFGLGSVGSLLFNTGVLWSALFVALQLYAAAQLILPALLLRPEKRNRGFYAFWLVSLALMVWLANSLSPGDNWLPLLSVFKSGLLLLVATLTGAALARYVKRLREIIPVCIVMTLADFASWAIGPTAGFSRQIQEYYLAPGGPTPLVDMLLIKLVFPGTEYVLPVFGISDWIMVVFFAIVAQRHDVNDNLIGVAGERLARAGNIGRYLPVSVVALFIAIMLAQTTGLFIPALPLIALVMLAWYSLRFLLLKGES